MKLIFSPPSPDDLIRLLRAWRFWLAGAILGALLGAAVYLAAPPPYRARATVNVDFHLEQASPQNAPSVQFYYLERETRKLEEIAMSDPVLNAVASQVSGTALQQLRGQKLQLSQPGNGGWHFYADDPDSQRASALASAWALAFAQQVKLEVANPASGVEQYIAAVPSQTQDLPVERNVSLSLYLLVGSTSFLALSGLAILFFEFKK
jgi:hypothetical protein